MFRVLRCGDTGLLLEFGDLALVRRMYAALAEAPPAGTIDLVPAATTLLVRYDPSRTDPSRLERELRSTTPNAELAPASALVQVPVRYDGADLDAVAEHTGLTRSELIEAHTGREWTVAFGGFSPGFAYLADGDPRLAVPRRPESRTKVPPGAVGLAGGFSAIYPRASPGGWQLIGQTDLSVWEIHRDPPALLVPGTRVKFVKAGR
ncbi:5-oxoprolinase subunit B family protein [Pseudonocardia acaciae]|uniref:5-oxoprolinase subunit B family protein n=1 Tax=Pseudonocardia acaciae TaxID=551276 RepID=UPI00048CC6D2|nr:allophanate hydrolase subunit 1 [Pseudonocardia acaciae]